MLKKKKKRILQEYLRTEVRNSFSGLRVDLVKRKFYIKRMCFDIIILHHFCKLYRTGFRDTFLSSVNRESNRNRKMAAVRATSVHTWPEYFSQRQKMLSSEV